MTTNGTVIAYLRKAQSQELARLAGIRARLENADEGEYRADVARHAGQVERHQRLLARRLQDLGEDSGAPDLFGLAAGAALGVTAAVLGAAGSILGRVLGRQPNRAEETLEGAEREALAAAESIAIYLALERIAANVGDVETSHLAREIRKEEEAMLQRLGDHIPELAGRAVPPQITEVA